MATGTIENNPEATKSKRRTRKVGGLRAFIRHNETSLSPVDGWPDRGPTTREEAKKLYVELKLTGRVELFRDAGALEAEIEQVVKFK